MTADTPIPAEAIEAAHRAAVATWHVMATTGHRQAVEAGVRAAAPTLLAAGRTAALRSAAEMFDALPPCPTYPDCTAGDEPHDRHETAGATLLRLVDGMEATDR